eukprot:7391275-Prymnesium_polylepis.2
MRGADGSPTTNTDNNNNQPLVGTTLGSSRATPGEIGYSGAPPVEVASGRTVGDPLRRMPC